jgi:hypothetical protein
MSVTVHTPQLTWARAHSAALIILVLCVALATTLGLLAARLVSDAAPAPTSSVSTVHLQPTDNGCPMSRPGVGTPC